MKYRPSIILIVMIILLIVVGINYYMTHHWYRKPQYTLGCRNGTNTVFRNVTLKLRPEGDFSCGILSKRNPARYMDPRWPIPESITLTFTNEDETKSYKIEKQTNIPPDFHGDITVVILNKNSKLTFDIDLKKDA